MDKYESFINERVAVMLALTRELHVSFLT